jgi:parB domain protein nuclease|nr:MAG TPA: ParB protein [Caudoviricetes sp.]
MLKLNYPIDKIKGAEYNPRVISNEQFEKLKDSIKTLGVIKPVIINKDGTIVAGHQRTKAMKSVGLKETPVFILKQKANIQDEIRFNLMHNSIETNTSTINIQKEYNQGFNIVSYEDINIQEKAKPSITKEISRLIVKYGDFGSCICDESGNIIHNSDYAFVCKLLKRNVLIYFTGDKDTTIGYLGEDYGRYNYDVLNIKPYVQMYCQMNRNGTSVKSSLYEKYIIPDLNKEMRYIDFGAGQCFYAKKLKEKGYKFNYYEPNFRNKKSRTLNIKETIKMIDDIKKDISKNKLYDVVVLDSVINSITSTDYEHCVMTACSSLLNENGILYLSTRNKGKIQHMFDSNTNQDRVRYIEFFDENDFSATFRNGVFTMQKFHTKDSLQNMCEKYFKEVEISGKDAGSNIYAICKKPLRQEKQEVIRCLEKEFNMEYPNGFKHNEHIGLLDLIVKNIFG